MLKRTFIVMFFLTGAACFLCPPQNLSAQTATRPDIMIADFESETYGDWKVKGAAFGSGPATGTIKQQGTVTGFEGKRLVNTYNGGDGPKGKLTSPAFKIERKFINFLIGGGGFKNETCMKLMLDGKEIRQATGPNIKVGGSEALNWVHWDVAEFEGKTAVIEIIDDRSGFWGHINVDHIYQSDVKKEPMKPNFKSKVPMYTYPTTLPEQLEALKTNPLLNRFHESRKKLSADRFRPRYHYVNPEAQLNDPNGLCFWKGNWHLFYQAYPPEDTRQHWGHAYSTDLVHWQDLPLAIYPDPEDKCYSGSALVEENRAIAIYHGVAIGTMIATSDDPLLLNWKKVTGDAVIKPVTADGEPRPFRVFDPCMWKEGEYYYLIHGVTRDDRPGGKRMPAWPIYRSKDLANWEYLHQFVEDDYFSLVGDDGACPYFWPIGDQSDPNKRRHILLHFSHWSGGKYLIGRYDTEKQKFFVTNGGNFNHGPVAPGGVHAPSAAPDGKGGVNVIFNMNTARSTPGWGQIMSMTMNLKLLPGDQLGIEPVKAFETLRGEHKRIEQTKLPANEEIVLNGVAGQSMEMNFVFEPKGATAIEFNVLRSPDKAELTRVVYYPNRGYRNISGTLGEVATKSAVAIDSTYTALDNARSRPPEVSDVMADPKKPVEMRIFVDQSIIEVFINGRQFLAQRVYPSREDSAGVSVQARGGDALLRSVDAWQMKSIYDSK